MSVEAPRITIKDLRSEFGSDGERDASAIDTIVIHSICDPDSEMPFSASACKALLDKLTFSSHYFIDRDGTAWQSVPEERQAWHAGKSLMPDGRTGANLFSIGIELLGSETSGFTDDQYRSLGLLIADVSDRRIIKYIVGHSDIAGPEVRPEDPKTDPWKFDWLRFRSELSQITNIQKLLMVGPQT